MKIKFTNLSEQWRVDDVPKGKVSELLSKVIEYGVAHYNNTKKMRDDLLRACNVILYYLRENEVMPHDWLTTDPLSNIPDIDDDTIQLVLNKFYISNKNVEWDLVPVVDVPPETTAEVTAPIFEEKRPKLNRSSQVSTSVISNTVAKVDSEKKAKKQTALIVPTDKTDLYLQCPKIPQIDKNDIWLRGQAGPDVITIYATLPKIPTKQNEISVTTDVSKMTNSELMNLYPNSLIKTRNAKMYYHVEGLEYDEQLGSIIPIGDFTSAQLLDNIVKYPHFYNIMRPVNGEVVKFYYYIEIDGELYKTVDVWDSIPETSRIPRDVEFIKEYVIRRYLLERDVLGIEHKYPMYGSLDPYITLFMPPEYYIKRGYTNTCDLAMQCVTSRVSFKQSRNPLIRRLRAANV